VSLAEIPEEGAKRVVRVLDSVEIAQFSRLAGKTVGIQFPPGLQVSVAEFALHLEKEAGLEAVLLGDPCFGACDLPTDPKAMGLDAVINLGHSNFPGQRGEVDGVEVIFVPLPVPADLAPVKRWLESLGDGLPKRVGLAATIQYQHALDGLATAIKEMGREPVAPRWGSRSLLPGQILGCSFLGVPDFDGELIVYIGSGAFHPLGIAMNTSTKVVRYDPESGRVESLDELRDRFLRRRSAAIESCRGANRFGIIASTKPGQDRRAMALRLKEALESDGREAVLVLFNEVRPDLVNYMGFDALVNTACSRLPYDDWDRFKVPILSPQEVEVLLGRLKWDDYAVDSFG
jgi:2-(3-amino-3-carboxypropyl)histidine synthase